MLRLLLWSYPRAKEGYEMGQQPPHEAVLTDVGRNCTQAALWVQNKEDPLFWIPLLPTEVS